MDKKLILVIAVSGLSTCLSFADDGKSTTDVAVEFEPCDAKFFTLGECQEWVRGMSAKLPIAKRAKGPFGLRQDPTVKETKAAPRVVSRAFEEALEALKVTAVHPAQDKFIVGAHELFEGDVIPLQHKNKKFLAQIISVRSNSIGFKNQKTGKSFTKRLATAKGVGRIKPIENPDGFVPRNPNQRAPIVIGQ